MQHGFFSAAMCGVPGAICGPRTVMCGVPSAICGPDSTHNEAPTLKHRFFVITITKIKRFFMGALVGALFTRNTNKTNNKQCISY
ncbi:hypothetical protein D3561_12580 [Salmonella enterica]|nr:hypothetical protein [Salmonella enterica]